MLIINGGVDGGNFDGNVDGFIGVSDMITFRGSPDGSYCTW